MLRHVTGRCIVLLAALVGCARAAPTSTPNERGAIDKPSSAGAGSDAQSEADPSTWIDEAERALERGEPARAATSFARYLGQSPSAADGRGESEFAMSFMSCPRVGPLLPSSDLPTVRGFELEAGGSTPAHPPGAWGLLKRRR
jgi:hypothetical protein